MPAMLPPPAHVQPAFAEFAVPAKGTPVAPYGWSPYVVRPGDTISGIAARYKVSVAALVRHNHLRHGGHTLHVGQRVRVPRMRPASSKAHSSRKSTTGRARRSVGGSTYVVRPGDTLNGISNRFRVSMRRLRTINGLHGQYVRAGQRIVIPGTGARRAAKSTRSSSTGGTRTMIVTVRSGDTLTTIARRYGVSVGSIIKANHLSASRLLAVGSRLKIVHPTGGGTTSTVSSSLSAAARASKAWLNAHPVPSRTHVRALIVRAAAQHGVDRRLALAIALQESGYDQRAVSAVNAIGVMQCMPSTGVWMSRVLGRHLDIRYAEDNIQCGVGLLRVLGRSAASQDQVIAAYYQGLPSVQSHGMYDDTKKYLAAVKAHMRRM